MKKPPIKFQSICNHVITYAADRLTIDGEVYYAMGNHRFGRILADCTVYDESGHEYKFKENDWIVIGASKKIELGGKYYLGVPVDEIVGVIPPEVEVIEDFSFIAPEVPKSD